MENMTFNYFNEIHVHDIALSIRPSSNVVAVPGRVGMGECYLDFDNFFSKLRTDHLII